MDTTDPLRERLTWLVGHLLTARCPETRRRGTRNVAVVARALVTGETSNLGDGRSPPGPPRGHHEVSDDAPTEPMPRPTRRLRAVPRASRTP